MFGPGGGEKHSRFLGGLENAGLRETVHGYHALESDTAQLSIAENYLLGMTVLCALRNYGPAAMFAKTLAHLGVPRAKLLEAVARLAMWVGGIAAADAAAHIQQASGEYGRDGLAPPAARLPADPARCAGANRA